MKSKIKSIIKDYFLEIFISTVALILIILNPDKAFLGVNQAIKNFNSLFLVIIAVAFLTGYISNVISKETIKKIIGKESGFKGVIIGALFGTLMVGPAYVFFPFFKEMLNKGARVNIIVTSIGAWAIKLQWLPFMIALLGSKYALTLNLLILIYAIISGYIVEFILTIIEKQNLR